jgi:Fe-S cluster assembly protein SufD
MAQKHYFDVPEYAAEFKNLEKQSDEFVQDFRIQAMDVFQTQGIPSGRVEEWKYTNLKKIMGPSTPNAGYFALSEKTDVTDEVKVLFEKAYLADISGAVIVLVDGFISEELSNFKEVKISALRDDLFAAASNDVVDEFTTSLRYLNSAFLRDGAVIEIPENMTLDQPVQMIQIATSACADKAVRTRNLINIGEKAAASVIMSFISANGSNIWTQSITDVKIAKEASLRIYGLQAEGDEVIHTSEMQVQVGEKSFFNHTGLYIGSKISRTEIHPVFTGEFARAEMNGAYLARNGRSQDIFTLTEHKVPNCESEQVFRGVLGAGGKTAFQGRVIVEQDAQLTNADQSNKVLLLDRNAEANAKPELLIYADDVKCTHGSTVGELDGDMMFYLQSRGLDDVSAKALLVRAFVAEIFEDTQILPLRERLMDLAGAWFSRQEGEL